jgi:hypothetical protein
MIKIESGHNHVLSLTSQRLTEVSGYVTIRPFYTTKEALRNALTDGTGMIAVYGSTNAGKMFKCPVHFNPEMYIIGCCTFTKTTFNKILKTMGLK